MAQFSVSLTQAQETQIRELVDDGIYANASEVIRDGMRALLRERELHAAHVANLRGAWTDGLSSGDAKAVDLKTDADTILDAIEDRRQRV